MSILFGIILSLFIFSAIVIIHELGHFSAARFFGVKVEEFGLGIPPRAKKLFYDKKGTLFSLNWLPIGGFVKLVGEAPYTFSLFDSKGKKLSQKQILKNIDTKDIFLKNGEKLSFEEKKDIKTMIEQNNAEYNLTNKSVFTQSIIILAGVAMNFLLAFLLFFLLFLIGVKPIGINSQIATNLDIKLIPTVEKALEEGILTKEKGVIVAPIKGSIAETSGLKEGDIILKINNEDITSPKELTDILSVNPENTLEFLIQNSKQEIKKLTLIPSDEGKVGMYIGENIQINKEFTYKYGVINSAKYAFIETKNQVLLTFEALGSLANKVFFPETKLEQQEALKSVSGPIGIVDFITSSFAAGVSFLIIISALISINLGVFNLLPIPALDGGRFLFILINGISTKVFGKQIMPGVIENFIHFGFFILLIALSILIGYNDIIKIFDK